jgi:uncharacterized secreted protein with C-terminal beta-propeller domain
MKRFFMALMALTFIMSNVVPAITLSQAADTATPFPDVYSDDPYINDIWYLKDENIVQGYEVKTEATAESAATTQIQFRPDYQINRAELVKIMAEALYTKAEIDACTLLPFSDVPAGQWFTNYVCIAQKNAIVSGFPDGTFQPAAATKFVEAAKIISISLKLKTTVKTGEEWYQPFVRAMVSRKGVPPTIGSFAKIITRGEMARMIHAAKEPVQTTSLNIDTLAASTVKNVELPQIDSCDALIEQLKTTQSNEDKMFLRSESDAIQTMEAVPAPTSAQTGAGSLSKDSSGAADYSQTNTQVKGVDEADVIKNDGKYIYLIKGNTVRIVEAYPGNAMKEIANIKVDDDQFSPLEMYVDNDQLVIIGNVYHDRVYAMPYAEPMMMDDAGFAAKSIRYPGPYFDQTRTKVYLYDIKDRSNPKKQRSIEIEGSYSNSRKVGKNVYFVLNQSIPYYEIQAQGTADLLLPRFKDSAQGNVEKPLVRCMGVQYFPGFQNRNYLIVAGLNMSDLDSDISRKVVLGSSQNIFASDKNLYVASPQYKEVRKRSGRDIFYESEQSTLVYRFQLNQAAIEYQNQGSVPGNILNQFSMDESGDTFRIATETNSYNRNTGESTSGNNLYVLDNGSMTVTGKIEGIAPNEHIKSVRFIGNRAYMVTFLTVDPLFVIDLSDKANPKVVGELKIPGWSDYLHPFDETHLIGFGRDVDPNIDADKVHSDYAVYYTALLGMKISMFDVSDVKNPKEMFNEVIGTRGTNSELLNNHKALLFDKDKKLLAFPITITEAGSKDKQGAPLNINTVFSGGIIYSVDLTNGFKLKGKVTHYENDDVFLNSGEYFSGEPGRMIQRMIYIGEYLYSISPDFVRSYTLTTAKPVNFIQLKADQTPGVEYLPTPPPGGMTR